MKRNISLAAIAIAALYCHPASATGPLLTPNPQIRTVNTAPGLGAPMGDAAQLSQSEVGALRARLMSLWHPPVGIKDSKDYVIRIRIRLGRDGRLGGPPQVMTRGHGHLFDSARDSAVRAVYRAQPFTMLSPSNYSAWKDLEVTFDPRAKSANQTETDEDGADNNKVDRLVTPRPIPAVPGALICQDGPTFQLMYKLLLSHFGDALQDWETHGLSKSLRRSAPEPNLKANDCVIAPPNTPLTLGAPVFPYYRSVVAHLANGRTFSGITMAIMASGPPPKSSQRFARKDLKGQAVTQPPAQAPKAEGIYLDKLNKELDNWWNALDDVCRGMPGDSDASKLACEQRLQLDGLLRKMGCRYTATDEADASSYWKCRR